MDRVTHVRRCVMPYSTRVKRLPLCLRPLMARIGCPRPASRACDAEPGPPRVRLADWPPLRPPNCPRTGARRLSDVAVVDSAVSVVFVQAPCRARAVPRRLLPPPSLPMRPTTPDIAVAGPRLRPRRGPDAPALPVHDLQESLNLPQ